MELEKLRESVREHKELVNQIKIKVEQSALPVSIKKTEIIEEGVKMFGYAPATMAEFASTIGTKFLFKRRNASEPGESPKYMVLNEEHKTEVLQAINRFLGSDFRSTMTIQSSPPPVLDNKILLARVEELKVLDLEIDEMTTKLDALKKRRASIAMNVDNVYKSLNALASIV